MTTDNQNITIGGLTIPANCRRIFITAELEPSNGDPRIQPTGFPDLGPVLYPDPSGKHGNICIIESEASMANRLEEVCFANKYEGTLSDTFTGLPYLRAEKSNEFKTASTIDGHRFASDFLAKGKSDFGTDNEATLADFIKTSLGMSNDGKTMPIARVPEVFELAMGLDTMSLIHGFQVSNEQISFVGLRHPRALTASIIGLNAERVIVPGIKFNVGQVESESGQAIFQKQRITCKSIQARFSVDVGLLASLRLAPGEIGLQQARLSLLLALGLWKIAAFLDRLDVELSLRSECKLKLKDDGAIYQIDKAEGVPFDPKEILKIDMPTQITSAGLPQERSPLTLRFS
ncbi:MAG: hypothetical protein JJU20_15255 [Opitutales bacterium]|nr:hypothetical protein [Opitutales bacterium]